MELTERERAERGKGWDRGYWTGVGSALTAAALAYAICSGPAQTKRRFLAWLTR